MGLTEEKKHPRVKVIELRGTNQQAWIDGHLREGWVPHYPVTTIVHPTNSTIHHFLTLTNPDQG